jgi:NAD(P)H-hydrate repair Nnr-like enzyme with NAD(P)H-hydrate dehydratase domain
MRPSKACLLALSAVLVLSGADGTVVATCKAAAESNKQVSYDFCVSELSKHHDSLDADTWDLAKLFFCGLGFGQAGSEGQLEQRQERFRQHQ